MTCSRGSHRDDLIVDVFAGGGGASLGIQIAMGQGPDIAIDHDPEAIAMHAANHPRTRHLCDDVWEVDPKAVCAGRRVALAWFSPECTQFSRAKSGKPLEAESRNLAWTVVRWAQAVRPRVIIVENVEEFADWGPLLAHGRPDPDRRGVTFRQWLAELTQAGYKVESRMIRASDFGAPTSRKRFFVIARSDGLPIVWPSPTHGPGRSAPYRTAADCMDWSLECPSIFKRAKPLADNTLRRINRGVWRYVIGAEEPFVVSDARNSPIAPTAVGGGVKQAIVAAFLARHYGGHENDGAALSTPIHTITTQDHHAIVTVLLVNHYGSGKGASLKFPLDTVTMRDRFGLVRVRGQDFSIADIGMRMLTPRELFRAQGFPNSYVINPPFRPLSKTAQMRMAGNSVCPPVAAALVSANVRSEEESFTIRDETVTVRGEMDSYPRLLGLTESS